MAFFTGKGDNGTTKTFNNNERVSKNSNITEALGSLDEINSFLGLCKVQSDYLNFKLDDLGFSEVIHEMQNCLFSIQAELAGAEKSIGEIKISELESYINQIEKKLPPIKSFLISGGVPNLPKNMQAGAGLGALLDIARTFARRAERRVVAVYEEQMNRTLFEKDFPSQASENHKIYIVSKNSLAYLNRLSSALYALSRLSNHLAGIKEEAPDYR